MKSKNPFIFLLMLIFPLLLENAYCSEEVEQEANAYVGSTTKSFLKTMQTKKTVTGQLRQEPDGSVYLMPDSDRTVSVKIDNAEDVSSAAIGVPLTTTIMKTDSGIKIDQPTLQSIAEWQNRKPQFRDQRYSELDESYNKLKEAVESAFNPETAVQGQPVIGDVLEEIKTKIVKAAMVASPVEQNFLVERYEEVLSEGKAFYQRNDNYYPTNYSQIYQNSRGSVALAEKQKPNSECSGVLIAKDVVLTCRHCVKKISDVNAWEIRFGYERDLAGNNLSKPSGEDRFPLAELMYIGQSDKESWPELDFALLKIKPNSNNEYPAPTWVQCLSPEESIQREDSIYVVGYPKGEPRTVHDNAYVLFPFQVSGEGLKDLELRVKAEFKKDSAELQKRLNELHSNYILVAPGKFQYYSQRFGQPSIGADSDTFRGDSGSPVYRRPNHWVIGLLYDGEEDSSKPYQPGWQSHEVILPISKIVEQLNSKLADWKNFEGLCIKN